MFLIKIYIKESYINYYHTIIQMCGQYCILAPIRSGCHVALTCRDQMDYEKLNIRSQIKSNLPYITYLHRICHTNT